MGSIWLTGKKTSKHLLLQRRHSPPGSKIHQTSQASFDSAEARTATVVLHKGMTQGSQEGGLPPLQLLLLMFPLSPLLLMSLPCHCMRHRQQGNAAREGRPPSWPGRVDVGKITCRLRLCAPRRVRCGQCQPKDATAYNTGTSSRTARGQPTATVLWRGSGDYCSLCLSPLYLVQCTLHTSQS